MKKLILLFVLITFLSCDNSNDSNNENDNSITGNYKIEYTTQLSDSDLDMNVTFQWDDENDQLVSETINVLNPPANSELSDSRSAEIRDVIGVQFVISGGGNFLSDTIVTVTNLDENTTFDLMLPESIGALGGTFQYNTMVIAFYTDNNDFVYTYGETN